MGWSEPKAKVVFKRKSKMGLGADQALFKFDPKGKNPTHHSPHASSSSTRPWLRLDTGQAGDLGATSSTGGVYAMLRTPVFLGDPIVVGTLVEFSDSTSQVGLLTSDFPGEFLRVCISSERAHLEQIQPVSLAVDADHEVLPRILMEVEDMHHSMVKIRERV
jgi:hypothetical protein